MTGHEKVFFFFPAVHPFFMFHTFLKKYNAQLTRERDWSGGLFHREKNNNKK